MARNITAGPLHRIVVRTACEKKAVILAIRGEGNKGCGMISELSLPRHQQGCQDGQNNEQEDDYYCLNDDVFP
jgi:hypothetical protein